MVAVSVATAKFDHDNSEGITGSTGGGCGGDILSSTFSLCNTLESIEYIYDENTVMIFFYIN